MFVVRIHGMKANELKKGMVFQNGGQNIVVKQVQVQAPSSRSGNTLYKVRGQDVASGQKFERSFKGEETVEPVDIARRAVQLLYRDADGCTFMDGETYEQYTLADDAVADELAFLSDGLEGITALITDSRLLAIELPSSVTLEIEDTAPGMKAASSSARTKPATLETGLEIKVPLYIEIGQLVKVDTNEFLSIPDATNAAEMAVSRYKIDFAVGGFRTEEGRLDLKLHGLFRIVAATRAMAIRHDIRLHSTAERLDACFDPGGQLAGSRVVADA